MADLSDIQASLSIKLSGATGAGTETNYANVDINNNLFVVVNNASGASAVNIQDGGNSLTIDSPQLPASLGQKTAALSLSVVIDSDQSYNNAVKTSDIINAGTGTQGALVVGTTAVNIRVGGSNLANRKLVTLHNNSLITWYWGYTNAVTTTIGTPLMAGQFIAWATGASQDVFVITTIAAQNGRVTEAA